ncbi:MAG: alkaline phosphatase, partial [Betaproteobacteria bacterium]|nr:alkaline phosphatase [Betaproteobacteria bacterium]
MVEAGQIDWAGHDNDPDWLFAEMKRMDGLLEFVEHFVDANPDTLVIV